METFFTLSILFFAFIGAVMGGPIIFFIILIIGIVCQCRRRSAARQEKMISELREIKYKMIEQALAEKAAEK